MESSIAVALAGQLALWRRLDLVANNMANANTTGFRLEGQVVQPMARDAGGFAEAFAADRAQGRDTVVYPLDRGSYTDFSPGPIATTGHDLDVAVDGAGYLAVTTAKGPRLTRDGRLSRAADGTLTGPGRAPVVAAGGGTIVIPEGTRTVTIAGDGTVFSDATEVGQIGLFTLDETGGVKRAADGLMDAGAAPLPFPEGRLLQGALEGSNVQPVRALVELVELQRGYDRVQNFLNGEDERIRTLIQHAVQT